MSVTDFTNPKAKGLAAVLLVIALYYGAIHMGFRLLAPFVVFRDAFGPELDRVGAGFATGALVQLAFVLVAIYLVRNVDFRAAAASIRSRPGRAGWIIALIAAAIHITTAATLYIDDPTQILVLSAANVTLSLISAIDGVTQEIIFRGYLLRRLRSAGWGPRFQIALSGVVFGILHLNYGGTAGNGMAALASFQALLPFVGTSVLGGFLAWSVQRSNYSILPAVVAHVLILLIIQPWLALSYSAG